MNRIASILCVALLAGCIGPNGGKIVTPARVEAVTALGTYSAGRWLINDGKRAELERGLAALQVIAASDVRDLVVIAAALQAAEIEWLETPEGTLAIGIVVSFQDLWSESGQQVLGNEYADAVLLGSIRGITLALAVAQRSLTGQYHQDTLVAQAKATRP